MEETLHPFTRRCGSELEVVASRQLTRNDLDTLFDAIVWKDVAKRHNVRNTKDLNKLAMYHDMSSPKTEKREVDSLTECAGELKCNNLVIVTNNDERTIEKDGYKIDLIPVFKF